MAEKALFHQVHMKNGHKSWWDVVPAQSAKHAAACFQNNDIAVIDVDCLGWCLVELDWDGNNVVFRADTDVCNCYFEPGVLGYDFLMNYFQVAVGEIMESVRESYDY